MQFFWHTLYIFKVLIEYPVNLISDSMSMFSVNMTFDKTLMQGEAAVFKTAINEFKMIWEGTNVNNTAIIVYSMDLKTVSSFNKLIKYADDTSLLVPQYSSVSLENEYNNII